MKTTFRSSLALGLLAFMPSLHAQDASKAKPVKAQATVQAIKQADPPVVSTATARTPQQAINDYKNSGKPTGPQTVKTNPVPSPVVTKSTTTATGAAKPKPKTN